MRRVRAGMCLAIVLAVVPLIGCATRASRWGGEGTVPDATHVVVSVPDTNFTFGFRVPMSKSDAPGHMANEVAYGSVMGGLQTAAVDPQAAPLGLALVLMTPINAGVASLIGWAKGVPEKDLVQWTEGIGKAGKRSRAVEVLSGDLSREGRQRTGGDWSASPPTGPGDALLVAMEGLTVRFDPRTESEVSINPRLRCVASANVMVRKLGGGPVLFSELITVKRQRNSFADLARDDGRLAEVEIRAAMQDLSAKILRRMYEF